jgi:hypothetical protein
MRYVFLVHAVIALLMVAEDNLGYST